LGIQGEPIQLGYKVTDAIKIENFPQAVACICSDSKFRVFEDRAGDLTIREEVPFDPSHDKVNDAKRTNDGDIAALLEAWLNKHGVIAKHSFSLLDDPNSRPEIVHAFELDGMVVHDGRSELEDRRRLDDEGRGGLDRGNVFSIHHPESGTNEEIGDYRTLFEPFDFGLSPVIRPLLANIQWTTVLTHDTHRMGCIFNQTPSGRWRTSSRLTFAAEPKAFIVDPAFLIVFEEGAVKRFSLDKIFRTPQPS
jgi:hypothetical protein